MLCHPQIHPARSASLEVMRSWTTSFCTGGLGDLSSCFALVLWSRKSGINPTATTPTHRAQVTAEKPCNRHCSKSFSDGCDGFKTIRSLLRSLLDDVYELSLRISSFHVRVSHKRSEQIIDLVQRVTIEHLDVAREHSI